MSFLGAAYIDPTIKDLRRRIVGETSNLQLKAWESTSQKWGLDVGLAPDSNGASRLGAKIAAHRAKHGVGTSFTMPMPQHLGTLPSGGFGSAALTVKTGAGLAAGDLTVRSTHKTTLYAGRFIKFANHTKLYIVETDVEISANTDTTVEIYPALRKAQANAAVISHTPDLTCYWTLNGIEEVSYSGGIVFQARISVEEAL